MSYVTAVIYLANVSKVFYLAMCHIFGLWWVRVFRFHRVWSCSRHHVVFQYFIFSSFIPFAHRYIRLFLSRVLLSFIFFDVDLEEFQECFVEYGPEACQEDTEVSLSFVP